MAEKATGFFKKSVILSGVSMVAISMVSASATAADVAAPADMGFKPYVSVFAGASILSDVNTVWQNSTGATFGTTYSLRTKMGYLLGGAIGVKWNDRLRAEVELSHSSWSVTDVLVKQKGTSLEKATGSISATYLMGNVWLDIPTQSAFTPYVGGGLGLGWASADSPFFGGLSWGYGSGEKAGLAYQLGAGVKFTLSDKLDLDLGYRFKGLTGIDFNNIGDGGGTYDGAVLYSHNIQLGLTYHF